MELDSSYVVHVTLKSKRALFHLIVPNFYQMVITARDEHGLRLVEVDASNGSCKVYTV